MINKIEQFVSAKACDCVCFSVEDHVSDEVSISVDNVGNMRHSVGRDISYSLWAVMYNHMIDKIEKI